jgi:hypothetical protein
MARPENVTLERFFAAIRDAIAQGIRDPAHPTCELMMRAIPRGVAGGIERAATAQRGTTP